MGGQAGFERRECRTGSRSAPEREVASAMGTTCQEPFEKYPQFEFNGSSRRLGVFGKKSGLTLVHWARKQKHLARIQIAAVTGLASFKDLKSIGEAGCDTCFTKPIDFRALREYLAGLAIHSVSGPLCK